MKFVTLSGRAMIILTIMVLLLLLPTFISCDYFDKPQETISSPISNDIYNPGKHRAFTDDWTDAGSTHNACMDMLDDSLVYRPLSSFASQEDAVEWVTNLMADHLIDELGHDTSYVNPIRRYWLCEGMPTDTRADFQSDTEVLLDSSWISAREYNYIYRLSNILFNPSWTETQRDDSLNSFKQDVNAIGWSPSEKAIVPLMSIAWYSNDWRHRGFDDSDPAEEWDIDWGSVFSFDVTGAQAGFYAGPWGAVGGAAVASGITVICWLVCD